MVVYPSDVQIPYICRSQFRVNILYGNKRFLSLKRQVDECSDETPDVREEGKLRREIPSRSEVYMCGVSVHPYSYLDPTSPDRTGMFVY